jgi:hypothetical protein
LLAQATPTAIWLFTERGDIAMFKAMAKPKHSARKPIRSAKAGKSIGRAKGGKLAHVTIARPAISPDDVDLKAVRKALRTYFRTHPEAVE